MTVKVPKKVATALEYIEKSSMNEREKNVFLLSIPTIKSRGYAKTLSDFAITNPTEYVQAIANGYEAEYDVQAELENIIQMWLNKPYVVDEKRDIKDFARMIIKHF